MTLRITQAMARTTRCKMPQWYSSDEMHATMMMVPVTRMAKITELPAPNFSASKLSSASGPKTNLQPSLENRINF
jgi:hypothetical protein